MQASKSNRIDALDGLRGIACLSVLLYHVGIMVQPFGPDAPYSLVPGTPSVMVFYVLSGVVLSIVPFARLHASLEYDWFGYFPRRVARLCVPLVVAIAIGVVAGFVASTLGMQTRSALAVDYDSGFAGIIRDVLMQFDVLFNVSDGGQTLYGEPLQRVDSPVWSMSWELWFSLSLPLVVYVVWKLKGLWPAIACIVVALFISHFSDYFPLRMCLMFVLGVLLAKKLDQIAHRKLHPVAEVLAVLAAIALIEIQLLVSAEGIAETCLGTLMNLACASLVAIAMTDGLLRRVLSTRPCRWLGKVSYSMYLTHAMVVGALAKFLPMMGLTMPVVNAACAIAVSFAVAWAFWRLIEKPSIAWSRSLQAG